MSHETLALKNLAQPVSVMNPDGSPPESPVNYLYLIIGKSECHILYSLSSCGDDLNFEFRTHLVHIHFRQLRKDEVT
jgi:hypothetical protein